MRPPTSIVSRSWSRSSRGFVVKLPALLYRGLPAILLGILFNTLDAG